MQSSNVSHQYFISFLDYSCYRLRDLQLFVPSVKSVVKAKLIHKQCYWYTVQVKYCICESKVCHKICRYKPNTSLKLFVTF